MNSGLTICFTWYSLLPQVKLSSEQRCVVCGVQVAMHSVLGDAKAGAHVIIVTRGDNRSDSQFSLIPYF